MRRYSGGMVGAVVVGLGGVGIFAAQIAAEAGAAVVGLDVDPRRLEAAGGQGVGLALDPRALPGRELRARVADFARAANAPDAGWTIFECSGTPAGQQTAWGLLGYGATLVVVGYTLEAPAVRLSNLPNSESLPVVSPAFPRGTRVATSSVNPRGCAAAQLKTKREGDSP